MKVVTNKKAKLCNVLGFKTAGIPEIDLEHVKTVCEGTVVDVYECEIPQYYALVDEDRRILYISQWSVTKCLE